MITRTYVNYGVARARGGEGANLALGQHVASVKCAPRRAVSRAFSNSRAAGIPAHLQHAHTVGHDEVVLFDNGVPVWREPREAKSPAFARQVTS